MDPRMSCWNLSLVDRYSKIKIMAGVVQFHSVAQLCLALCDPMDCSMPGLPVHHQLPNMKGQKNDTCKRKRETQADSCHNHSTQCESSVQFSPSIVFNSLRPPGLQHHRFPCPSPTPRVYSNSCPLSRWCHPTISSSVIPFSSGLQSFPASGSFKMSQVLLYCWFLVLMSFNKYLSSAYYVPGTI